MTDCVVGMVTVSDIAEGRKIAAALVERGLAACVNIIPEVCSIYRWDGVVQEGTEAKLMIKTLATCAPMVTEAVRSLHSYDVCEVTFVSVVEGNAPYLQWIRDSVTQ